MRAFLAGISDRMVVTTTTTPAVLVAPLFRGLTANKERLHE